MVSNDVINRMGLTFIDRMRDETGHPECTITRAYIIAQNLFNAGHWWQAIDSLDNKVSSDTQRSMRRTLKKLIEATAFWFLRNGHERPLSISKALSAYSKLFDDIILHIEKNMTPLMQKRHEKRMKAWMNQGLSREMAKTWSLHEVLKCAADVATIAIQTKVDVKTAMHTHFSIGEAMRLEVLHQRTREIPVDDNWQRVASQAIREGLYGAQTQITCQALTMPSKAKKPDNAYVTWKESKTSALDRYFSLVDEVSSHDVASHAMMNVVLGQLRGLV